MSSTEYLIALGRAVTALRSERGISRGDLAQRSGVSYPYVSEIETGRKSVSLSRLIPLAEALGVAPSDILRRAEGILILIRLSDA